MAFVLGRAMFDTWTGYAAAALLAAAPLYFGLSQVLVLDMPVSAFMTVALGCVWLAYTGERRRLFTVLAHAAAALAVLTKGPMALLLPGAIVIVFLVLQRDIGALRWLCSPLGVLVFAVIALPWFVVVSVRNPEFVNFFVVKQHVDRFFRPDEHQPFPTYSQSWVWFLLVCPSAQKTKAAILNRGLRLNSNGQFTW